MIYNFLPRITNDMHGELQIILGPMFSGKTTELFRRVKRYTIAEKRCLVIKYIRDTRYSVEEAATHDKQTYAAVSASKLWDQIHVLPDYDVIGIDEGQFFPDLVEFCEHAANEGKIVIVAALDGTFQRKPFGSVLQLIPLAENITKLTAVCMVCFQDAHFTKRLGCETEVEVIGGADKYIAVCRKCFHSADNQPILPRTSKKRVYAAMNAQPIVPATAIIPVVEPSEGEQR